MAVRSSDDRQVCHRLLQHLALARRAIIGIYFPPRPWPMTSCYPVNGNFAFSENFGVASYNHDADVEYFWTGMGPVYASGKSRPLPPGFSSFARPVRNEAVFSHIQYTQLLAWGLQYSANHSQALGQP